MNIRTIHIISQYLAAAGSSFLEKRSNNSHFNLIWSSENGKLLSPPLNKNGYHLAFDYNSYIIGWVNSNHSCFGSIELEGKSHSEILDWIKIKAKNFGIDKPYNYEFNYKIPYPPMTDDYVFPMVNFELMEKLASSQSFAQEAIDTVAKELGHDTELSICPQNFDLKTRLILDNKIKIDVGFAIPDAIINDYCFYVKAWKGDKVIDSDDLAKFSGKGEWLKKPKTAAVLINKDITTENVIFFIKEAIQIYSGK